MKEFLQVFLKAALLVLSIVQSESPPVFVGQSHCELSFRYYFILVLLYSFPIVALFHCGLSVRPLS